MIAPWRLMDYLRPDGKNPFRQWYGTLSIEAQVAFDDTVLMLAGIDDWADREGKEFRQFTRKETEVELSEIRFWWVDDSRRGKRVKRKFRALGLYRPNQHEFIFLGGFEKSGRIVDPQNAIELALKYKQNFESGRGSTRDHI